MNQNSKLVSYMHVKWLIIFSKYYIGIILNDNVSANKIWKETHAAVQMAYLASQSSELRQIAKINQCHCNNLSCSCMV